MSPHSSRPGSRVLAPLAVLVLLASVALVGCSDNKAAPNAPNPTPPATTTYEGTISGSGTSGSLTLTIATGTPSPQPKPARARANVSATGTLVVAGGGTVSLSGSYDDVNKILTVGGGGWTFTGGLNGYGMEGVFGGPGGISGVFSVQQVGTGTDTVIVVVGDFTSTTGGPGGVFNFSIRNGVVHGNAFENGGSAAIPLDGTYDPLTGDIVIDHPQAPGGPPLATGNLAANGQASGFYDDGAGEAGTWAGTKQ